MNIKARFDLETAEGMLAPQIKKIAPTRRRESDALSRQHKWRLPELGIKRTFGALSPSF
jgi:hypothetical protein